jgi:hypothetical protein
MGCREKVGGQGEEGSKSGEVELELEILEVAEGEQAE